MFMSTSQGPLASVEETRSFLVEKETPELYSRLMIGPVSVVVSVAVFMALLYTFNLTGVMLTVSFFASFFATSAVVWLLFKRWVKKHVNKRNVEHLRALPLAASKESSLKLEDLLNDPFRQYLPYIIRANAKVPELRYDSTLIMDCESLARDDFEGNLSEALPLIVDDGKRSQWKRERRSKPASPPPVCSSFDNSLKLARSLAALLPEPLSDSTKNALDSVTLRYKELERSLEMATKARRPQIVKKLEKRVLDLQAELDDLVVALMGPAPEVTELKDARSQVEAFNKALGELA